MKIELGEWPVSGNGGEAANVELAIEARGLVRTDFAAARRQLGVVPQELVFDPFFNVRETLKIQSGYFGVKHNDDWIDELLHSLGLTDKANANMRQLSGGMKRRVMVAQALVHKPPVIVLDEPTAGVDVELRQTLWQFIARLNKEGHTVLLTTHYLEEAEALCQRIGMLKAGRIVALDRTSQLLAGTASTMLRFKTDAVLPPDIAARARVTGRIVQFPAHNAGEIEQDLGAVRQAGLNAEDVEIRKADLEDVFLDVAFQTVCAPVLTAVMYLLVFGHTLEDHVKVYDSVGYTQFLIPGLVMMSVLQNAFANSSSSLIQSKITGNLVFLLLTPLSPAAWFVAYVGAAIVRGLAVGTGVLLVTAWFA
eukprot:gene43505-53190_t